jgi:hypothetical protein
MQGPRLKKGYKKKKTKQTVESIKEDLAIELLAAFDFDKDETIAEIERASAVANKIQDLLK